MNGEGAMNFGMNEIECSQAEIRYFYLKHVKPVILKDALFADGTADYVQMLNEKVRLRFRTGKNNVGDVFLRSGDARLPMRKEASSGLFDYYQIEVPCPEESMPYYFEIVSGKMVLYYNKKGVQSEHQEYYDFKIIPGFHTPDWAKGAVFYQIFVDRFYNGDPSNDVEEREYIYIQKYTRKIQDWNSLPEAYDVSRFYGGDLQGVMDKLDYLQGLGVDVIYLNPIFVSPSNHKYDIQDYDYVDPHYGKIIYDSGNCLDEGDSSNEQATKFIARVTDKANLEASNALFSRLVQEIHRRGMRIILDGVFNHCGSFNKWMDRERIYDKNPEYDKGAYVSGDSPYRNFFSFHSENWPNNGDYDGWWGHETLPKLNYEGSEELYKYILGVARKWLSPPYNIDGWRLDVAADLGLSPEFNHRFWKDFRKAVKEINPDALILAEHYGDPSPWLQGDEWDTVMNYDAFMEPVTWMLTGVEKHSDDYRSDLYGNVEAFQNAMDHHMSAFHSESLYVAMNELSNHDHSRFLTRTNHRVGRIGTAGAEAASDNINYGIFREAVLLQMTWPGAPTIYYGDEAGVCGWTDPDNRRTYPWGAENKELIAFHRDLIRIHKEHQVLKTGSYRFLAGGYQWLAFGRFNREEQMITILNNDDQNKEVRIPVWILGIRSDTQMVTLMRINESGYYTNAMMHPVQHGYICVSMERYSGLLLKAKNKSGH